MGVLRGLFMHSDFMWSPLFDSRIFRAAKENEETYWPMGCTEIEFQAVICRGDPYPVHPRPLINDLPLSVPLCDKDVERSKMEEKALRNRLNLFQVRASKGQNEDLLELTRRETELDKLAIQLIAMACKNEQTQRVLDLSNQLFSLKTLDGAIKLASYNKMITLAERLTQLKEV